VAICWEYGKSWGDFPPHATLPHMTATARRAPAPAFFKDIS
jgi:hypothetical protein